MADNLVVSGGGVVRVATEEMASDAAALRAFSSIADDVRSRLCGILQIVNDSVIQRFDAPNSVLLAGAAIEDARSVLFAAGAKADILVGMLGLAAEGYGAAEHLARAASLQAAAHLAYGLGRIYPMLLTWFTPHALGAAGAWLLSPKERRQRMLAWLGEHSDALSDPRVVQLVRLSVMSVDEFGAGAVHVPPELLGILGDEALGVLGFTASARALTTVARHLGLATETPVKVTRTHSLFGVSPPTGAEDRTKRIPAHSSQIRIDRYEVPGEPDRFEVYIGGTKDFSMASGAEPFDMTSNLTAMSMGDAGSMRAVALAMKEAGVTAETPVQFTGHSQGAIIAVRLANSGDYDTRAIFTVGGPTGQLDVPDGVPYLALEHSEDVVTAIGGSHTDLDTVLVRRSLFDGEPVPDSSLLPAHELSNYRESAALLDSAEEGRIVEFVGAMNEFTEGATSVDSTRWMAKRGGAAPASPVGSSSGGGGV